MTSDTNRLVLQSWKLVEPNADPAVELYFRTLFAIDPGLRANFPGDLDREGKKLFSLLSTSVRMLDAIDELVPVLVQFAAHYDDIGIEDSDYGTIGIALINTLRHTLGPAFDHTTEEAWIDAWSLLSGIAVESRAPAA